MAIISKYYLIAGLLCRHCVGWAWRANEVSGKRFGIRGFALESICNFDTKWLRCDTLSVGGKLKQNKMT